MSRVRQFLSRIWIRLLAFNVLLVFLPAAGLLYLDTYERQLLESQERAMVQQGRLLAAALAKQESLDVVAAERILIDLDQRLEARLRLVGADGKLLADSSHLGPLRHSDKPREPAADPKRSSVLYRVATVPIDLLRRLLPPSRSTVETEDLYGTQEYLVGPEIRAALAGRYGAATRVTHGQRSLTLFSAIPIRRGDQVVGAVLVSKSTYRILQSLYEIRLDVFKVVLASVGVAMLLSLLVSTTIARRLHRLRDEARAVLRDRRGRLTTAFRGPKGRDEIGDLGRALEELTDRLHDHIRFIEGFASDVSHELKNPLASIRVATEMLAEVDDPDKRRHFLQLVQREVARMERLLSGVREISRLDAELNEEEKTPVDLQELLRHVVEAYRLRENQNVQFELTYPDQPLMVNASADRLTEVFENILDNAVGFSPAQGVVRIEVATQEGKVVARIYDQGPGIPASHLDRIFDRFFSYRPDESQKRGEHTGLGLAIVKAIVEGYGGSVTVANETGGGVRFEVRLPVTRAN